MNGRLPDATLGAQHLRDVFYRMGFDDEGIVALSGGHTVGRCHLARSGFDGPWTHNSLQFDNTYFKNLLNLKWKKVSTPAGREQYADEETGKLMMLPTDICMLDDAGMRPWVDKFAASQDAFFDS